MNLIHKITTLISYFLLELFSLLKAEWLHLVLYFSTAYCNSRENVIILFLDIFWGDFFLSYNIQHCFICRPSDSTVPTDAGIEHRTVATGALTVRRSNH